MIDTLYSLVLLLNMTGLFRVLALPVGSSSAISAALLMLNLVYLVYRFPVAKRLLRQASILEWGALIVVWPMTALLLLTLGGDAGSSALRAFFVHTYLLSLLLGSAVFVSVRGWQRFRLLAFAAVGVTAAGMAFNWVNPFFFNRLGASVADSAGKVDFATASLAQVGDFRRAAGFYIEPNLTALSCNVLMFALLASYRQTAVRTKLLVMGVMLLMVGASGSRGGLLVNLVIGGLILWQAREQLRASARVTRGMAVLGVGVLIVLASGALIGALSVAGDKLERRGVDGLANRLRFWSDFGEGGEGDILEDSSVKARLEAQRRYLVFIGERPLIGHGPDGTRRLVNQGRTEHMSHNLYFEKAFRYGLPYLGLVLLVFFRTYQRGHRWRRVMPENASSVTILVALLACAGMVAGGVLESRAVVAVVGAVLGQQCLLRRQLAATRAVAAEQAPLAHVIRA